MAAEASAIILDTGALVAVERGSAAMRALIAEAKRTESVLLAPAAVLAQAWRGGTHQALLSRFLDLPFVEVDLLTRKLWESVGVLCGRTGTRDVVDAAVVICARARGAQVAVTSDPSDLRKLDDDLVLRTP